MKAVFSAEERFRNKINIISILCAVLVVFLHSFSFNDGVQDAFAYHLEFFISRNIAQAAVPVFFAVSGFLFYRNFDLSQLLRKWKSRFRSLVIPYLLWNTISMVVFYFISKLPFINTEAFELNLENILNGVVFYRYNLVFWFVFQLILLTYICPVLYGLLKKRGVALAVMAALWVLYAFEIKSIWQFETRAILFYAIGAYLAMHHEKQVVESDRLHFWGIAAFAVSQVLIYSGADAIPAVYLLDRVLLAAAVFDFSNLLADRKLPQFLHCSFPIYAMHNLILEFFNKVFSFVLSPESNWILLDYFLSSIFTIAIIAFLNEIMVKYLPRLHGVLFGGRVR